MIKSLKLLAVLCFSISVHSQQNHHNLLIGTYTNSCKSDGIYVYDFNSDTADFELKAATKNVINPSFLTLSPDKKFVYAVNENGDKSEVSSFTYDKQGGKLELLNQVSSNGADPCHIINDEKNVLTANYTGGTITILNKKYNGSLSNDSHVVKNEVHEKNEEKPRTSHVHMLQFSPDKKYLISSDLGSDYLHVFNYSSQSGDNPLSFKSSFRVKKGAGPRHFTFSSNGKFAYLLNELDGSLIVLKYNDGNLKLFQKTTVIERHFKGKISAAEIVISADGKFLYATNRGDANTISCFEIKENGKLKLLQTTATLGKGPRNFTIDPSDNFLLIGHQYTNNIVVFKIDKATGLLTDSGKRLDLCSPVCLVFE